jgi:hypothetical protein
MNTMNKVKIIQFWDKLNNEDIEINKKIFIETWRNLQITKKFHSY